MTEKRIKELADFFYSSNNSDEVPIRIMAATGQFSGFDFSKVAFIELMKILNKSMNLKEDLLNFREEYGG